jgi:hypothetical protein
MNTQFYSYRRRFGQTPAKYISLLIFILPLLNVTSSAQTPTFECKDAQGRKILASRCPLGSTIVKEIEVTPVQNGLGQKPAEKKPTQSLWAKEIEFKERQKQKEEQAALERDKQRRDEEKCYQNQKRLNSLLSGLPITTGENTQGEPILMEDEQRLEEIRKVKEKLKNCRVE